MNLGFSNCPFISLCIFTFALHFYADLLLYESEKEGWWGREEERKKGREKRKEKRGEEKKEKSGLVVRNPAANVGDTGSSPGPRRSHILRSIAWELGSSWS